MFTQRCPPNFLTEIINAWCSVLYGNIIQNYTGNSPSQSAEVFLAVNPKESFPEMRAQCSISSSAMAGRANGPYPIFHPCQTSLMSGQEKSCENTFHFFILVFLKTHPDHNFADVITTQLVQNCDLIGSLFFWWEQCIHLQNLNSEDIESV